MKVMWLIPSIATASSNDPIERSARGAIAHRSARDPYRARSTGIAALDELQLVSSGIDKGGEDAPPSLRFRLPGEANLARLEPLVCRGNVVHGK